MHTLEEAAPAFVAMAHRIVWCTVGTVTPDGRPATRILHPIWEWTGTTLTGWIATSPQSPKAADLAANPRLSLTYWDPTHDTCTADCDTEWEDTPGERQAGWDRFKNGPAPVGYDPAIIPQWSDAQSPAFGILRLTPCRLRIMPGSLMLAGKGELVTWRG